MKTTALATICLLVVSHIHTSDNQPAGNKSTLALKQGGETGNGYFLVAKSNTAQDTTCTAAYHGRGGSFFSTRLQQPSIIEPMTLLVKALGFDQSSELASEELNQSEVFDITAVLPPDVLDIPGIQAIMQGEERHKFAAAPNDTDETEWTVAYDGSLGSGCHEKVPFARIQKALTVLSSNLFAPTRPSDKK